MQSKLINTRASPNKSQDSGFSDSGESETSSSDLNKGKFSAKHCKHYSFSEDWLRKLDQCNLSLSDTVLSFLNHCNFEGHVTKVYFYSNNAESHYQSPSSLPVLSSVTRISTGNGTHPSHTHGASIPDRVLGPSVKIAQRTNNNNKSEFHWKLTLHSRKSFRHYNK